MEKLLWIIATDILIGAIYLIDVAIYKLKKSNDGHRYLIASFLLFLVGFLMMIELLYGFSQ